MTKYQILLHIELLEVTQALDVDLNPFQGKLLFDLCIIDANYKLTFVDFKKMWNKQEDLTQEYHLKENLRTTTENGGGCFSRDEMEPLMRNVRKIFGGNPDYNKIDQFIKSVDIDLDERVKYGELLNTIRNSTQETRHIFALLSFPC